MNKNALSIVATHDLELAENCDDKYLKYYFCEDIDENEGLTFDFKLKQGICNTGNAIKLLEFLEYPKEITINAKAYKGKYFNNLKCWRFNYVRTN
jgi:DNA mismatch repair ATPase MutS